MKTTFAILGQLALFFLFLALFAAGGFLGLFHADPFHAPHWFVTHPTATATRYFVPSGLFFMTILYTLVLAIEAATRRLRTAGLWSTLAFFAALLIGILSKFGFVTTNQF